MVIACEPSDALSYLWFYFLCRKLREMDKELKICFLTATELLYFRDTDSDGIDDLGTHCFVAKPVDTVDLISSLKAILSQK
jgi:hypothetical protein